MRSGSWSSYRIRLGALVFFCTDVEHMGERFGGRHLWMCKKTSPQPRAHISNDMSQNDVPISNRVSRPWRPGLSMWICIGSLLQHTQKQIATLLRCVKDHLWTHEGVWHLPAVCTMPLPKSYAYFLNVCMMMMLCLCFACFAQVCWVCHLRFLTCSMKVVDAGPAAVWTKLKLLMHKATYRWINIYIPYIIHTHV